MKAAADVHRHLSCPHQEKNDRVQERMFDGITMRRISLHKCLFAFCLEKASMELWSPQFTGLSIKVRWVGEWVCIKFLSNWYQRLFGMLFAYESQRSNVAFTSQFVAQGIPTLQRIQFHVMPGTQIFEWIEYRDCAHCTLCSHQPRFDWHDVTDSDFFGAISHKVATHLHHWQMIIKFFGAEKGDNLPVELPLHVTDDWNGSSSCGHEMSCRSVGRTLSLKTDGVCGAEILAWWLPHWLVSRYWFRFHPLPRTFMKVKSRQTPNALAHLPLPFSPDHLA